MSYVFLTVKSATDHVFHRILHIQTAHVFEGKFKPQLQVFQFCFKENIISSEKSILHFLIQKIRHFALVYYLLVRKLVHQLFCATNLFNPTID